MTPEARSPLKDCLATLTPATAIYALGLGFASLIAYEGTKPGWVVMILALMILFGGGAAIADRSQSEDEEKSYGPWIVGLATLLATYGLFHADVHNAPTSETSYAAIRGVIGLPFGIALITRFRDSRPLVALQLVCSTAILSWTGVSLPLNATYALFGCLILVAWPLLMAWVPDRQPTSKTDTRQAATDIGKPTADPEPSAPY